MRETDAVVVSAAEWRSLCSLGELRMLRRRVHSIHPPLTDRARDRLFLSSPVVKLGDASDTLILELASTWRAASARHSRFRSDVVVVTMEMVESHHCVDAVVRQYFEDDAARVGVRVVSGRYDEAWSTWVGGLLTEAQLRALSQLLSAIGLTMKADRRRVDGYRWQEILSLAEHPKRVVRVRPKHVEDLLRSVRPIAGAIAGVYETTASVIATNLEWIALRTKKQPLSRSKYKSIMTPHLAAARARAWTSDCAWTTEITPVLDYLRAEFPRAYTDELSPQSIPLVLRVIKAAKDRKLEPAVFREGVEALRSHGRTDSAILMSAAVTGVLGPAVTLRLARHLALSDAQPEFEFD